MSNRASDFARRTTYPCRPPQWTGPRHIGARHLKRVFRTHTARNAATGAPTSRTRTPRTSYCQRITHFTEELSFLSEEDKDWVMGRAIMQRLKWT